MTSLPGGAADKLGNQYEGWWTAYRAAAVLEGDASTIRIEPPGPTGAGVEFWIDDAYGRWFEQVKGGGSATWTIRRLTREQVIGQVLPHLVAGHRVRFVFATAAPHLTDLSDRARAAESLPEFKTICSSNLLPEFQNIVAAWSCSEEEAWTYLRRITVEHHPPESLHRIVTATYARLVDGDPDIAIDDLCSWFVDQLHQSLTAPLLWDRLEGRGIGARLLAGDKSTIAALKASVRRHELRTTSIGPSTGLVRHPGTTRVVERLQADDGKQIVLLHGRAGHGKSTIAASTVEALARAGWLSAAVRMDGVGPGTNTASALGRAFGLNGSPAILLGGAAGNSPSVLLIDQLDAVSTYSGRMPDAFEAVAEIIDELDTMPHQRLLLVVRTVDLEGDPRLRQLVSMSDRVEKIAVDELVDADVRQTLSEQGIDPATVAHPTLDLLRVPLHFAIFMRLPEEARTLQYRTLQDLYEAFTADVRKRVEAQVGSLDWGGITDRIVTYMSDNEMLTAPAHLLDSAPQLQVGALESAAVLVRDGAQVGWLHESYFDFLFARSFISSGQSLLHYLSNTGQHLFRRAPTRQVLEHLAAVNRPAFRAAAATLLTDARIRPHLHEVVVAVLRDLDAMPADWNALEALAFSDRTVARKLLALLATPAWFDAADSAGRWEDWLNSPDTMERAANQLVLAARERPQRVDQLVRPFVGQSEVWRLFFRSLIQWSLSPALVDLAIELISRGEIDGARGPIAVNSDFWSILYSLTQAEPGAAVRLTGAYLRRCAELAGVAGNADAFASGHLSEHSPSGHSLLMDMAAGAPDAFVEEVLPFVRELCESTAHDRLDGLRGSTRWGLRYDGEIHSVDDALFFGLDLALRDLATASPDRALPVIRELATSDIEDLRFLACRSYAHVGEPDEAVEWLLSDQRNLALGWADSPRWASRELIEGATQSCSGDLVQQLSTVLLDYYPEWETQARTRQGRGRSQYELLTALPEARVSPEVQRRIGELERKFPTSPPAPSRGIEAHWVGPPIASEAAELMSDDDWRRAIAKYQADETNWTGTVPVGGARELSHVLKDRTKNDPHRFIALALGFDSGVPAPYFTAVIEGAAGSVLDPDITDLLVHASTCVGSDAGMEVCRAIQRFTEPPTDAVVDLLRTYAHDPDPESESARTPAHSGDYFYGGDLHMAGINCTRGTAALAIAHMLFRSPEHADALLAEIESLADDPILAVRTCACECVVALMNASPIHALDIAERLLSDPDPDVYDSRLAERLLTYAILREPERFEHHLRRALEASASVAQRAGHIWAVAVVQDLYPEGVQPTLSELTDAARRGIAEALASEPSADLETLIALLDDTDDEVRRHAAWAARQIDDLDHSGAREFVRSFVRSRAFEAHFDALFFALDRSHSLLPEETIEACERAVQVAGGAMGDISTRHSASSTDVIAVVLRLYRQGDDRLRSRCLDVIDRLTEIGAYGLEDALIEER
jgi:hypothetical protein